MRVCGRLHLLVSLSLVLVEQVNLVNRLVLVRLLVSGATLTIQIVMIWAVWQMESGMNRLSVLRFEGSVHWDILAISIVIVMN